MGDLSKMVCDRCKKPFYGYVSGEFTAGFYVRGPSGEGWEKWMFPEEKIVCDICMQADPRYLAVYGPVPKREE